MSENVLSSASKYIIYVTINTRIRELSVSLELANVRVYQSMKRDVYNKSPTTEAAA